MADKRAKPNGKDLSVKDAQSKVLALLEQGANVTVAMSGVGRNAATFRQWTMKDNNFKEAATKARLIGSGIKADLQDLKNINFVEFSETFLDSKLFPHQLDWLDLLEGKEPRWLPEGMTYEQADPSRVLINVPPEHAKSTTITINKVTHQIVTNPNSRVIIVSKTQGMARKFLGAIKTRLTHPNYIRLQTAFGPSGGYKADSPTWSADMIYLGAGRDSGEKDPTIQALGMRGQIYGARADLIIMDDCVDHTNAHEYEKQIDWIQSEVMSRVDNDGGKLLVVGTRLRPKDLYSELRDPMRYPDETSPWTYFAQPAVLEFKDEPEDWVTLWAKTNMPPVSGKGVPDENGLYTKWDGAALYKKRGRMSPNLWAMVYQQQQVHEDSAFPSDAVKGVINGSRNVGIIPKNKNGVRAGGMDGLIVVAGLDPAMAGYTAAVCLGIDIANQKRYLLDVSNVQGMKPDHIRDLMKDWTDKYGVSEWRVEKNAFQAMLTQDREVREYLSARGATLKEHHTGNNKWDTDFGVASLTTLFYGYEEGSNLIEFPSTHMSEGLKALIEQLVTWYPEAPKSQKTDTVMALWFAELAARDRIANATHFARTHAAKSMFYTRYDQSRQVTVNLSDYAYNN